jgi:hypothetical protein
VRTRREFLSSTIGGLGVAAAGMGRADLEGGDDPVETVRDRLWIWSHDARFYGGDFGLPGASRITPIEGAVYMGLRNVMFIQYQGVPTPPFEQYFVPFRAMDRVYWTLSNNGGTEHSLGDEQEHVYRLARENPNIVGLLLDDFLIGSVGDGPATFGSQVRVDDLVRAKARMRELGLERLSLAVVIYSHQLDPAIVPLVAEFDAVLFWTWKPERLPQLEPNLARLRELLPGKRVLLGCYMWDFDAGKPMPMELMPFQCDLGLQWLREGAIEGMIFLGTNICDLGIEAVEWTRAWIAEHGDEPLRGNEP